jgi:hypothetical protein
MNVDDAITSALKQAKPVITGDREQMLVVFDVDGDAITFTFETPRFNYPLMHKTGVQVAYLHPECAVLITKVGEHIFVSGKTREGQQKWMLLHIGGDDIDKTIVLDGVALTSIALFWDGVREEE